MGHWLHLLSHALGIDTQRSHEYDFWSGFAASGAAWVAILFAWFTLRIELRALRLETKLLARELEQVSDEQTKGAM